MTGNFLPIRRLTIKEHIQRYFHWRKWGKRLHSSNEIHRKLDEIEVLRPDLLDETIRKTQLYMRRRNTDPELQRILKSSSKRIKALTREQDSGIISTILNILNIRANK